MSYPGVPSRVSSRSPRPSLPDAETSLVRIDAVRGALHIDDGVTGTDALPVRAASFPGVLPYAVDDERFGIGPVGEHVDDPFAHAFHMLLAKSAVIAQRAFHGGVDASLQTVGGGGDGEPLLPHVNEREQHAVAAEPFEPEIGAAEPFVRVPPFPSAGVFGIVLGECPPSDETAVARMPSVEGDEPFRGILAVIDVGERPRQREQLPAGVGVRPVRQVASGVAQHVHRVALDPDTGPFLARGGDASRAAVAHQRAGTGDPSEQRAVRGLFLRVAPLPRDGPPVPVGRDEQAPAVARVSAVGLDAVVDDAVGGGGGPDVPAPRDASGETPARDAETGRGLLHRFLPGGPCEERAEFRHPGPLLADADLARPASAAAPSLASRRRSPVLAHRGTEYS